MQGLLTLNPLLLLLLLLLLLACRADGRGQFFYLPRIRSYNGGATGEAADTCLGMKLKEPPGVRSSSSSSNGC
jgi:hypothetical protein